jgi:biopolymer transport protein ExbD
VIARQQREDRSRAGRVQDRMMGSWLSSIRGARTARNLVDVVLVLAIVLLVMAPAARAPERVPRRAPVSAPAIAPVVVSVHGDGSVTIDADGRETTVPLVQLAAEVAPLLAAHPGRGARIDVADLTPYGIALDTMDTLDDAGCGPIELARR